MNELERHPDVSAETAEKLLAIVAHVKDEPRRMDMEDWYYTYDGGPSEYVPPCGTVACLSGWAVELFGPNSSRHLASRHDRLYGQVALGITIHQVLSLFYVYNWPHKFQKAFAYAKQRTPECVAVVEQRVLYFIRTGE